MMPPIDLAFTFVGYSRSQDPGTYRGIRSGHKSVSVAPLPYSSAEHNIFLQNFCNVLAITHNNITLLASSDVTMPE